MQEICTSGSVGAPGLKSRGHPTSALHSPLWMGQLVPAALTGSVPAELAATGLPTNPVHVLDLAFILPLHIIGGIALWRMRTVLALIGPMLLVFGALMAGSIAFLVCYMGNVGLAIVMSVLALVSTAFAVRVLTALR